MAPFRFKQFTVEQDRCGMKIGTDGVLLGAWASLDHQPASILDIGTGTGVLALMLAQRSRAGLIDAVEIDEEAYEQSVENFENSNWGDRLFCYHAAFDEFVEEMYPEQQYDLIISNPPFYSDEFQSGNPKRNLARFSDALPFEELLKGASLMLSDTGTFNVIIPKKEEEKFLTLAKRFRLLPTRLTRVRGDRKTQVKRSLVELRFEPGHFVPEELIIESSRHHYTKAYIKLVQDFYLKM